MSTPVYYLKISVKILNKMTVCKPQRRALMWAMALCLSIVAPTHPLSSFSVSYPPKANAECAGECEKETEQEEQRGTEVDEEEVGREKQTMYSAFVLIIPPRLGDIQAASVPQLGFGGRVISGSVGECLQRSSVSHVLRRKAEGAEAPGGYRRARPSPLYGRSGRLPSHSVLGNEKTMSLDVN